MRQEHHRCRNSTKSSPTPSSKRLCGCVAGPYRPVQTKAAWGDPIVWAPAKVVSNKAAAAEGGLHSIVLQVDNEVAKVGRGRCTLQPKPVLKAIVGAAGDTLARRFRGTVACVGSSGGTVRARNPPRHLSGGYRGTLPRNTHEPTM